MEAELDEMKHRLMESVETERIRLAQQLHDGSIQDLYGVFYMMQEAKNWTAEPGQQAIEKALELIKQINDNLSFIIGELRPSTLTHLGLNQAIQSHSASLEERFPRLAIHLDLMDEAQVLPPPIRLALFRIYQNLMSNILRHSEAQHVWVRTQLQPGSVILEVQDNGKGFKVPSSWISLVRQGRFGLAGIVERVEALNGQIEFDTSPGKGTLVRVTIPNKPASQNSS